MAGYQQDFKGGSFVVWHRLAKLESGNKSDDQLAHPSWCICSVIIGVLPQNYNVEILRKHKTGRQSPSSSPTISSGFSVLCLTIDVMLQQIPGLDWAKTWGTIIEEEERLRGIIAGSLGDESFDPSIAVAVAPVAVEALSHTAC